jgi:hypothetical protein
MDEPCHCGHFNRWQVEKSDESIETTSVAVAVVAVVAVVAWQSDGRKEQIFAVISIGDRLVK